MKKLVMCLLALFLTACSSNPVFDKKDTLKIAVANDLHYFAKENYEQCEWFEEMTLQGDGKMVTHTNEILDAFMNSLISNNVDIVILNGDLTFNGEVNSHKELATILEKFEENGITVAVNPGNHDIDNIFAKGYGADDYFDVDNVSAADFKNIYKNLGYDIAVSKHKESLSYEIILNDQYSLMMLDTNGHDLTTGSPLDSGGQLTESTMTWLKERLEEAKSNKRCPIVMMHHNLAIHSERLYMGYTIYNYEEVSKLLADYGVPVAFSGHIHIQSIADIEGIKDVATSALSINPLQYGLVELNSEEITYRTENLEISVDSAKFYEANISRSLFDDSDEEIEHFEEIKEVLLFANRSYFSGSLLEVKDELMAMEGYSILMNAEDDNEHKTYLLRLLSEENNHKELKIDIKK